MQIEPVPETGRTIPLMLKIGTSVTGGQGGKLRGRLGQYGSTSQQVHSVVHFLHLGIIQATMQNWTGGKCDGGLNKYSL